jgi:hypothetical protein
VRIDDHNVTGLADVDRLEGRRQIGGQSLHGNSRTQTFGRATMFVCTVKTDRKSYSASLPIPFYVRLSEKHRIDKTQVETFLRYPRVSLPGGRTARRLCPPRLVT